MLSLYAHRLRFIANQTAVLFVIGLALIFGPQHYVWGTDLTANDAASLIAASNIANSNTKEANSLPSIRSEITINGSGFAIQFDAPQAGPVYIVNTTDMTDDGLCGISHCSLIEVINAANADGTGSLVNLGISQTYTLRAVNNPVDGANGLPSVTSPISINGNHSRIVRDLDTSTPPFRIFYVAATGNLFLSDTTISNGASASLAPGNLGGGILNLGSLTIFRSELSGNTAERGGGIWNYNGTVTINNSTLSGNSAVSIGGGIYNTYGTLRIFNSTLSGNSAEHYAGIYNNAGTVAINNSTLLDNRAASNGFGGGIFNSGSLIIFNSTLSGNSADLGGGIYNGPGGLVTITNSTLAANSADYGGGIYFSGPGGLVNITNSTLSGNSATHDGGGIFSIAGGYVIIQYSTLSGNSAANGGGIANSQGFVEITNSIVANSTGGDCTGDGVYYAFNNRATGACGTVAVTNPDLILRNNGGPSETHALLEGSNAIDEAVGCPSSGVDQRGQPRPQGNRCDIGAYESPFTAPPGTCADTDQDGVCDVEELSGPNKGDSNHDSILDSQQAYVASLRSIVGGSYVTLITDMGQAFANLRAVGNPSPGNTPAGVNFPVGFFEYTIAGVAQGEATTVTMLLPSGTTVNSFYKYGRTSSNPTDHWYQFTYQVATATGAGIFADRIVLHFVDGSRGDDDLVANGFIVEPGAPGYQPTDTNAPTASPSQSPAANGSGWNNSDVTVDWNWADNAGGSGIDYANCITSSISSGEGAALILNATCKDLADNTGSTSYMVKVDKTPPTLSPVVSNPVYLNGTATVTSGAADALSGVASESCGPLVMDSVGAKSVTCTATDYAGNTSSATVTYTVIYVFSGFFQPVDNLPTQNTIKAGSAIPVKFSLAGNRGLFIFPAGYPVSQPIACNSSAPSDEIEQTIMAGGSSLSYDPVSNQYTYVWNTDKAWAGTCRQLMVRLIDGTEHKAIFRFK